MHYPRSSENGTRGPRTRTGRRLHGNHGSERVRGVRLAGRATVRQLPGRAVLRQSAPAGPLDQGRPQGRVPSLRGGHVTGTRPALGGRPGLGGRRGAARGAAAGRGPEGRLAARLPDVLRSDRRGPRVLGLRLAGVRAAMRGRTRPPAGRMLARPRPLRCAPRGRLLLCAAAAVHAAPGRSRPWPRVPLTPVAPRPQAGHTAVPGVRRQRGRVRARPARVASGRPRRAFCAARGRRAGHQRVRGASPGRPQVPRRVRRRVHDGTQLHAQHQTRVRRRRGRRVAVHTRGGCCAHRPRQPRHGHVHTDAVVHAAQTPTPAGRQMFRVRVRAMRRSLRAGHPPGLGGVPGVRPRPRRRRCRGPLVVRGLR